MSGNYGDIVIGDYLQQVANPSFVTVEAAPGQTPVFSTLYIRSTNKWVFKGIKVQSLFGTNNNKQALVTVTDQGAALPTTDIILQNMQISSADSTDGWSQADWLARARVSWVLAKGNDRRSRHDLRFGDQLAHFQGHIRCRALWRTTRCSPATRSTISATTGSTMARTISRSRKITSTTTWTSATEPRTHMDGMQRSLLSGRLATPFEHPYRQQPGHPPDRPETPIPDLSARDRRLRRGLDEPNRDEQRGRDQRLLGHLLCERAWRQDHQQHGRCGRFDAHARELQAARGRSATRPIKARHPAT